MTFSIERTVYCLIIALVQIIYILVPSVDFLQFRNPTVSGKFIVFLFIIEIAAILFFIRNVIQHRTITVSLIDILFAGILVYITLNRYFFQPVYGFSIRYYELLGLFTLYLILKSVNGKNFYYLLFTAVIIGANIQIIIGLLQLYGFIKPNNSYLKVTGSFFNSGPYAGYLAAVFPISVYMLKFNKTLNDASWGNEKISALAARIIKCLFILNIFGCVILIPALKSRACYLAISCTIIFIYRNEIRSFINRIFQRKVLKYISPFILLISAAGLIYFMFTFKKGSSEGRYLVLKAASGMVADKPILGFGYDRFRSDYMNYQAAYFTHHFNKKETILADNTVYPFNEPLQFFIENGAIGFIMLIFFVYILLKYAKKKDDHTAIAITGLMSIFVFSLFAYPSEILPIKLLCFLYISILAANYTGPFTVSLNIKEYNSHLSGRLMPIVLLIFGSALSYQAFTQTLRLMQAYITWEKSYTECKNTHFINGKKGYQSVHSIFETNGDFLTDYGKVLFFTQNYTEGIGVLELAKKHINNTVVETTLGDCQTAMKDYMNAERSYLVATHMTPNSFTNKYLLFKLYQKSGQNIQAVNVAKEILGLTVKVPSALEQKVRNEATIFLGKMVADVTPID